MTDSLPVEPVNSIVPSNESERLAALHRYQVLDTPAEAAFDRITTLAARLFKMPIALISLVDESRAWLKSSVGFGAPEVPRNAAICNVAVLTDEPLIIPDTRLDDRFTCNPFVQCEPATRFYAGAPLIDRDGFNLGTLCLLDTVPHEALTAEEEATLVDLAAMVVDELELRLAAQQMARVDAALVEITQGVAKVTGGEFFDELVKHFAKVLGTDYVYIGLVDGYEPKMMKTIATCDRGQIVENLEYRLQDTPCWEAIEQRKLCCYPRNVRAQFPDAPLLEPLAVESYVAIPFFGTDGHALGLLGVMDGKPLENVHLAESLLTIFASRIATELDRQQHELILAEQTRLLEKVATGQSLDECLGEMCSSIAKLSPHTRACVLLNDTLCTKFPRAIAPDFPSSLSEGLKDAPINELAIFLQKRSANGTCGTAVYCGEPVTCHDIASDDFPSETLRERWSQGWRDLGIAHGIRACYSVPIMGIDNLPLGSLILCFNEARPPTDWEYRLSEFGAKIASITIDRKRSIEDSSESEERLNLALAAADMATWDADLSTGKTIWSAQHFEILGYDQATVDAPTVEMCMNRVHPDDLAAVMQGWETAQRERSLFCSEHRFVRFDTGSVVWVASTGQFLDNYAGAAMRFVGVMFDITERKIAETAAIESQQRLQSIVDAIPHAVWVVGADGEFRFNNQQWLNYYGMSFPEAMAISLGQIDPAQLPATQQQRQPSKTGMPDETEFCWHSGGESDRWYLCRAEPILDPSGQIIEWVGTNTDITNLKQAEAASQMDRDRLTFVLNTTGVGLWLNTLPFSALNWDERTRELFFMPPDVEPTIELFWSRIHPEDREPTRLAVEAALRDGTLYEIDHRAIDPDTGEIRWIRSAGKAKYAPDGTQISFDGINYDITEQQVAAVNLAQSNARFESAMLAVRGTVYEWNLQTKIIYRSKGLFDLLGFRPEDVPPKNEWWRERVHPDDLERVQAEFRAAPAGIDRFESEYRVRHAAGHWVYVSDRSHFQYDASGELLKVIGFNTDITDRKRAEEELRQSQAIVQRQLMEIEAIYQTAPIGLTILDRDLRYERMNQRLAEINGISIENHIGRTLREIVPTVADENEPILRSVLTTGEPLLNIEISGETQAQPGVERTWIQNCYPLKDETGQSIGINVVVQEITDRKRAEAALAERNQELDSFVHTVSHDLKAPLRAIANLSVWIEEDLDGQLPPGSQHQLQQLRNRVKRMESMVDNLLLYARSGRQQSHAETFDCAELIDEIIDSISPPAGFTIEIQPPLPTLTTKRVFLNQVLTNLISNAIKHHTSATGNLHIAAIEHLDCHEFILQDDGPGIAPEHHERIFDIFQTLKGHDNSDSTGVGLAIVKKIVETEAGTIRLESRLGQGTTFYVTWPKSHH
jgi:PAS domain S-box-containing protein